MYTEIWYFQHILLFKMESSIRMKKIELEAPVFKFGRIVLSTLTSLSAANQRLSALSSS